MGGEGDERDRTEETATDIRDVRVVDVRSHTPTPTWPDVAIDKKCINWLQQSHSLTPLIPPTPTPSSPHHERRCECPSSSTTLHLHTHHPTLPHLPRSRDPSSYSSHATMPQFTNLAFSLGAMQRKSCCFKHSSRESVKLITPPSLQSPSVSRLKTQSS